MCSFLSFLSFVIEVGEEIEEVFGTIFLIVVGEESDGFLEFLPSGFVVGFAGPLAGGVIAVEHRGNFEQMVPHLKKIRIENLFRRLHSL